MDRRQLLAEIQKAGETLTTTSNGASLLQPDQSRSFIQTIKDKSSFGSAIRLERRRASSGEINKLTSGSRLIRGRVENDTDDGYRAPVTFPKVEYQSAKYWLPWEVSEDEFHENIEEQALEAKITDEMTSQFALDWDDLDVNGDESQTNDDFVGLNDGLLKLAEDSQATHRVDGSQVNSGDIAKEHFYAAKYQMPNKYVNQGNLKWLASPNRITSWSEYLTERETPVGDAALFNDGKGPLGIEFFPVPAFPDDRIVLADPKNFIRVVTWDVRKGALTGATDKSLLISDSRFYLYYVKPDFIILEDDAVVDIYDLNAITGADSYPPGS